MCPPMSPGAFKWIVLLRKMLWKQTENITKDDQYALFSEKGLET